MVEIVIPTEVLKRYVDDAKRLRGLTDGALARRAGISGSALSRLLKGQRSARRTTLDALERAAGLPLPPELRPESRGNELAEPSARFTDAGVSPGVPVYALIGAPVRDSFYLQEHQADATHRLPGVAHAKAVYAIRMPDTSMTPWRRPNELIFIDPLQTVGEGDHALVEMVHPSDPNHPRHVYRIRRYLGVGRSGHRVRSYQTEIEEQIPSTQVTALLRIMEWAEVAGVR